MTERWRATCRGGDRGAGARPLAKPRCDHHEAGLPRTASARAHWWPTPRGMRLHSLSESESVSGTSLEASDTGGMSELSEQLTSTVTRRETEHSISKCPCHRPRRPRRSPTRDGDAAPRAGPGAPPGSGGRGAGARRCKRATARTVTEHGARRGRAARDRSSDRPTATWHGRRVVSRGRALGTFPCSPADRITKTPK